MNWNRTTTIQALEDLRTLQYHAVAINDGKLANNGEEASGIIMNKANTNDHLTVGYIGEMKYAAGAAISKGDKLTVTTSGWFTTAGSDDYICGEAKADVTSGSYGTGIFAFPTQSKGNPAVIYDVTPVENIPAGRAYALNDSKVANNGAECNGIITTAITTAGGQSVLHGVVPATLADSYGPGQGLVATTSGYLTAAVSGDTVNGVVLVGATSGQNATVMFHGAGFANA